MVLSISVGLSTIKHNGWREWEYAPTLRSRNPDRNRQRTADLPRGKGSRVRKPASLQAHQSYDLGHRCKPETVSFYPGGDYDETRHESKRASVETRGCDSRDLHCTVDIRVPWRFARHIPCASGTHS